MSQNRTKNKQVKIYLDDETKIEWEHYLKSQGLKGQQILEDYIKNLIEEHKNICVKKID